MAAVAGAGVTDSVAEATPKSKPSHQEPIGPCIILPNPLVDDLSPKNLGRGVLIPLKTSQEVRQDHTIVQAYITRAPTKSANDVIKYA